MPEIASFLGRFLFDLYAFPHVVSGENKCERPCFLFKGKQETTKVVSTGSALLKDVKILGTRKKVVVTNEGLFITPLQSI